MNRKSTNIILAGIVIGIAAAFVGVAVFGESMTAVGWTDVPMYSQFAQHLVLKAALVFFLHATTA